MIVMNRMTLSILNRPYIRHLYCPAYSPVVALHGNICTPGYRLVMGCHGQGRNERGGGGAHGVQGAQGAQGARIGK